MVHKWNPRKTKLKEGDDPSELNTWEMANSMIGSWTLNVVTPKLHISVTYVETTLDM